MRILFADDSMTAQNMGKKILTDAGYEVVAVSNGAAAVKKIAEQKPDIIILDIYMPGYTGLEVCDKVRASVETLKTPVLLTVGKMEPYRAEDANRVKADGVIIKPFEASDLLAVIRRLEERVTPRNSGAIAEQTVRLERPPAFEEFAQAASENHKDPSAEVIVNTVQGMVDVPDNMATAAAFSDLLGSEPEIAPPPMPVSAHESAEFAVFPESIAAPCSIETEPTESASPVRDETAAPESSNSSPADAAVNRPEHVPEPSWDPAASASYTMSDFGLDLRTAKTTSTKWSRAGTEEGHPASAVPKFFAESATVAEREPKPAPLPQAPEIPVVDRPDPNDVAAVASSSHASVEEMAVVPAAENDEVTNANTDSLKEPEAQPSAVLASAMLPAPEPPAFHSPEPPPSAAGIDSFSSQVEAQIQHIESIVAASEARHIEPVPSTAPELHVSSPEATAAAAPVEDDFDARVAAAMSIYDAPVEVHNPVPPATDVAGSPASSSQHETIPELPEGPTFVEPAYSFEYSPPIASPEREVAFQPVRPAEDQEQPREISHLQVQAPVTVESSVESADIAAPAERTAETSSHEETPANIQQQTAVQPKVNQVEKETIASELQAQMPAESVAAAVEPGADSHKIASVVHRVLERLKPHLIEEIARELKSHESSEEK